MKTIKFTVDSRNRIFFTKPLPDRKITSVKVYRENDKIILQPMVEISAREVWFYFASCLTIFPGPKIVLTLSYGSEEEK